MTHQRLPRATAFEARGVILKDRAYSWSGVSAHDGNVVLAMRSVDIHIGDHGSSCLLWAPALEWVGGSSKRERLEHCELAMLRGTAEGLFDYGERAGIDPAESVSLRVIRLCGEYWAKWGSAARLSAGAPARFFAEELQYTRFAA
jgi:hypothetical protein